jgi:hypothetical protein
MVETKLFQVEPFHKSVNEPDWIFFVIVFVDGAREQHCLVSLGSIYMFAHSFSVVLKLALSLTVSSEHKKRLFSQSEFGLGSKRPHKAGAQGSSVKP